jgi:hypothetical protein
MQSAMEGNTTGPAAQRLGLAELDSQSIPINIQDSDQGVAALVYKHGGPPHQLVANKDLRIDTIQVGASVRRNRLRASHGDERKKDERDREEKAKHLRSPHQGRLLKRRPR